MWWNCAGMTGKINIIKTLINDYKPIALFLFESNINTSKINSFLNVPGYDLIFTNSSKSRTACYAKQGVWKIISQGDGCEAITLEHQGLQVSGVYRPFKVQPGHTLNDQFDALICHLGKQIKQRKDDAKVLIAGDFNLNYNRDGDATYGNVKMLNDLGIWCASNGLSQRVKDITRRRTAQVGNSLRVEESLLDHLYSTEDDTPELIDCGASDHLAIGLKVCLDT